MMVSTLPAINNFLPQNDTYFIPLNGPNVYNRYPDVRMVEADDEEEESFYGPNSDIIQPKVIPFPSQQTEIPFSQHIEIFTTSTTQPNIKALRYKREGKSKSTSSLFPPQKLNRTKNQMQIIKNYQEKMRNNQPQWTKLKERKPDLPVEQNEGKDIQTAFRELRVTSPKRKEKEDSDDINEELASISKKAHIAADITPRSARCAAPDPISMLHGEAPITPRDIATVDIAHPAPLLNIKEQVKDTHKDSKVPPLPLCKIKKDDKELLNPESPDRSKYLINLISPRTAFTSPRARLTPRGQPLTPKLHQREGPLS